MEILSLPENEPFITGIEESIDICSNQIIKLADASIFHCRSGKAHIEIDLQAYEVTENTQLLLLPGSIFNCTCASHDFTVSYIVFSDTLFREITSRLDPSFFHFLKEHPCIVIPEERVKPFIGLSLVMKDLYEDRDNSFRIQIFKNFIQNFILDFYDKTQHLFLQKKTEGINRQEEIFKRFIQLIHKHCTTQREVSFYAAELFITPRYLSTIVQNVSGNTAKSIIDRHVILEIKALLQSTSLSIQEISNRLSFPDQSFFGRYFKKHAKTEKRRWAELIDGYLESDRDIRLTFLLLDMRHAPSKDDLQMIEYLIAQEMPFVIVLTKADKLNKSQRKARMEAFQTEIPYFSDIHVIPFSAMTREGVDEVRDVITELAEADETDAE